MSAVHGVVILADQRYEAPIIQAIQSRADALAIVRRCADLAEVIAVSGEKYTQARPLLRDKTVNNVCGLCDVVGQVIVSTKDGERYVRLEGTNTVVAKDRLKKRKFCRFEEAI